MITELELTNFTAFKNLAIDFSPKINVIIGENSTGKTLLLKAAYTLCSGGPIFKKKPDTDQDELLKALTTNLLRVFLPLDETLGKMRRHGVTENAQLQAQFSHDSQVAVSFHTNSKGLALQQMANYENYQDEAVFIPTKEVLSFMKGFSSLYEKYGLSFDQTYQDICLLLDLPNVRPEILHEKSAWAIEEIESICGGRFVFHGGGRVTFKTKDNEYSANAMAEGFRKMGMLARLLETGAIQPGSTGPLFWDEPESNINPKLMRLLVEILLELSRNGQQIILATHEYVLLKWFDLLMDEKLGDEVRFHRLYKDPESDEVKIESVEDYQAISSNSIADTFNELTKEQVSKKMGSLGK